MVNVQLNPAPVQAPVQPRNGAPFCVVAVNVIGVPSANDPEQPPPPPQLMPAGLLVTVPLPFVETDSLRCVAKFAITFTAPFAVIVQLSALPLQAPPHPLNTLLFGDALKVIEVPGNSVAVQVPGQRMPPMLVRTSPDPFTVTLTAAWSGTFRFAPAI